MEAPRTVKLYPNVAEGVDSSARLYLSKKKGTPGAVPLYMFLDTEFVSLHQRRTL